MDEKGRRADRREPWDQVEPGRVARLFVQAVLDGPREAHSSRIEVHAKSTHDRPQELRVGHRLAEVDEVVRRFRIEVSGSKRRAAGNLAHPVRLTGRPHARESLAEADPVRMRRRRGVQEDQPGHAIRMPSRVLHRQEPAPGMADQADGLDADRPSQPIEVAHLRRERHVLGPNAIGRSTAAALVVVDEASVLRKPVELGQEVRRDRSRVRRGGRSWAAPNRQPA